MAIALMQNGNRVRGVVSVFVLAAALTGCGAGGFDGIEVNSKLLDSVGLTSDAFKKTEAKTQPRAPLVLPPDASRLPEPGAAPQAVPAALAAGDSAWPLDPEKKKLNDAESKKLALEKYCKDGNWKQQATKDEVAAAEAAAKNGTCGNSLFGVITGAITGNKE